MFCERIFISVPCTISTGICHTNFPEEKFEFVTDWLSNKKPPYWVVVCNTNQEFRRCPHRKSIRCSDHFPN